MTTTTTNASKRGLDLARGNLFMADPITELCIVGGADTLGIDESSDLDTDTDKTHALYDPRLKTPLDPDFVRNIDAFGIITPVVITRIGELVCVVAGRRRVRGARAVNRNRKATGQPLIKVPCVLRRTAETGLLGAMIAENEGREDDAPLAKLEKLKRYMERGVTIEDAAVAFSVKLETAKGWLAFDDHAVPELRKMLADDRITFYAALRIARLKDPDKQRAAIADATSGHGIAGAVLTEDDGDESDATPATNGKRIGYSKASNSAKKGRGKSETISHREMKRMLDAVREMPHPNANEKTLAWWEGVEDALVFVLGADGEVDDRLAKILADGRAAAKAAAKKREAAKAKK